MTVVVDSSNSLFFPRFWGKSVEVRSGGAMFGVVVTGTGKRPARLEGIGLGVVVRGPGIRSV